MLSFSGVRHPGRYGASVNGGGSQVVLDNIYLWIIPSSNKCEGQSQNQRSRLLDPMGWRDCPMDFERYFFVAGMTCFFVLVGMGFLTLSL